MSPNQEFRVNTVGLNLRREPRVKANNVIVSLSLGDMVTKIAEAADPKWWQVSTTIQGSHVEGFVNHSFLVPAAQFEQPQTRTGITEVHLETSKKIARSQASGRAFPLNEAGQPDRDGATDAAKVADLTAIIKHLNVEKSARYIASGGATFCNIYAYDYCFLAGVYLPRVWWMRKAIATLAAGGSVTPKYNETVSELNANSLYNWLEEFGQDFGWVRTFDLTDLQNAAGTGQVCIVCAQRTELNRPGHICAVVPETQSHQAKRSGANVTTPLQSQAGASNFNYGGRVWWTGSQFRKFGFWKHA